MTQEPHRYAFWKNFRIFRDKGDERDKRSAIPFVQIIPRPASIAAPRLEPFVKDVGHSPQGLDLIINPVYGYFLNAAGVDGTWGGGAEAGAGGAWQVEVDDCVAISPGCPFGGDARAEEGNGRDSQADGQMQHAGIAADQQGTALQDGGGFHQSRSPRQVQSAILDDLVPRLAILPAPHDDDIHPRVEQTPGQFPEPFRPPSALGNTGAGEECDEGLGYSCDQFLGTVGGGGWDGKKRFIAVGDARNVERTQKVGEALHLIIIMGIVDAMGEHPPSFVGGETDLDIRADQTGDHRRKAVPLLGVDDDVVTATEHLKKFGGAVVEENPVDLRAEVKDRGIAFFGEDFDCRGRIGVFQGVDDGDKMNGIADAAGTDEKNSGNKSRN